MDGARVVTPSMLWAVLGVLVGGGLNVVAVVMRRRESKRRPPPQDANADIRVNDLERRLDKGDFAIKTHRFDGATFDLGKREETAMDVQAIKAMFTIDLGKKVTDRISGLTGIVTGRCDYITGCNRYQVSPRVGDDNKSVEPSWIDEHVLDVSPDPALDVVRHASREKPGAYGSDPR